MSISTKTYKTKKSIVVVVDSSKSNCCEIRVQTSHGKVHCIERGSDRCLTLRLWFILFYLHNLDREYIGKRTAVEYGSLSHDLSNTLSLPLDKYTTLEITGQPSLHRCWVQMSQR